MSVFLLVTGAVALVKGMGLVDTGHLEDGLIVGAAGVALMWLGAAVEKRWVR